MPPQEADGDLRFLVIQNDGQSEQHLVWCAPRCAANSAAVPRGRGRTPPVSLRCRCGAPLVSLRAVRRLRSALTPKALRSLCRLVDLKNIYAKQLPNMPKDYIVRLVFDRGHKSLIAVKVCTLAAHPSPAVR